MQKLYRNHRVFGWEVARVPDPADTSRTGRDLVILQTTPHRQEVALAHLLMEVSVDEVSFEARMALTQAIQRARFLGLGNCGIVCR